jgi:hypothetical protein
MLTRFDHLSQLARVQLLDDEVSTPVTVELLRGSIPHTVAFHKRGIDLLFVESWFCIDYSPVS